MGQVIRRICAAAIVVAMPIVWCSAQQFPGRLDVRRSSSRYSNRSRSVRAKLDGPINFPARPLPAAYALLLKQSIFAKDHVSIPDESDQPRTRPSREASLVLRGVMCEGQRFLANVEYIGPNRIKWLSEGDPVPSDGGRVQEITLDHIVIVRGGGRRLIHIGESLDGGKILDSASADANSPTVSP